MLELFNNGLRRVAVMQNAWNIRETEKLNGVGELYFDLPATDEKARLISPHMFVRYNGGEVYRTLDYTASKSDTQTLSYTCEHAIATLADRVMFQDHIFTGYSTKRAIEYILSFQSDWVLGECEFEFYYDYAFSSENLLNALLSIATPFSDDYRWEFDTKSSPWTINLRRLDMDAKPQFYIFSGLNFLSSQKSVAASQAVTRLYCLGYGEGVNQLDIRGVNGGVPYLDAPQSAKDQYGIIEAVLVDRSCEDASSLLALGQAAIKRLSAPRVEYTVSAADLYGITRDELHRAAVGKIVLFKDDNYKTVITEITKSYDANDMQLTLSNTPQDVVGAISDLYNRQRIEATYSQGATQLWGSPLSDNASPSDPLTYRLWIPQETKIMNRVMVKISLARFRTYSRTTSSGGGSSETSDSGGGAVKTTESGGGAAVTSGASSSTTTGYATSVTNTWYDTGYAISEGSQHYHTARIGVSPHTHNISHSHTVNIPAHTHEFEVPSHTHEVNIPSHTHAIEYGIYRASQSPAAATVTINSSKSFSMGTEWEGDITEYLIGDGGVIPRGQFIDISVKPDKIAYITISVAAQGFIQSRGGGQY